MGILERQQSIKNLCDEVETARKFTHLRDRLSAGGGCEAAVTARTRCGLVKGVWYKMSPKAERGCLQKVCSSSLESIHYG